MKKIMPQKINKYLNYTFDLFSSANLSQHRRGKHWLFLGGARALDTWRCFTHIWRCVIWYTEARCLVWTLIVNHNLASGTLEGDTTEADPFTAGWTQFWFENSFLYKVVAGVSVSVVLFTYKIFTSKFVKKKSNLGREKRCGQNSSNIFIHFWESDFLVWKWVLSYKIQCRPSVRRKPSNQLGYLEDYLLWR